MKRRGSFPWVVALVLVSAAGLTGLGLVSMWRALQSAEARARDEARQTALASARGLRTALSQPALLDLFGPSRRFDVRPDRLVVPADLGWVTAPPPELSDLSFAVEALLARAERIEFGDGKPEEARRILATAAGRPGLAATDRQALQLAAAWVEDRCADPAAAGRDLDAVLDDPAVPVGLARSALLLAARTKRPLPPWTRQTLLRLAPDEAAALLRRMRQLGAPAAALDAHERAVQEAEEHRGMLRAVWPRVPFLQEQDEVHVERVAGGVLVYQPSSPGWGSGLLVRPEDLVRRLRAVTSTEAGARAQPDLPQVLWSGRLAFGAAPSADSLPVWPGAWIVPPVPAPAGAWTEPWVVALLLAALAAALVSGLLVLLRALGRERAALRLQRDFLGSVTHELKTPLASIRMFAEMLDEDRVPAGKTHDYHRLLASEAQRLAALVDNVLDLGRMERGERGYDMRLLPLDEVLRSSLAVFRPVAARKGLELAADPPPSGARVRADRDALLQALLNVLDNAGKYAAGGRRLDVTLSLAEGAAQVRIQDDGPGVPAGERERIFERFRRGSAQENGAVPGVGLGLYLARRIARAHGGDLTCAAARPGAGGACFVLSLPLAGGDGR